LCGTQNGISCAHLPNGLGNTGCAEIPLSPVQGLNNERIDENWQTFWTWKNGRVDMSMNVNEIAGVEISGGCSAYLQISDHYDFKEVILPGFTALQGREEIGEYDYYGEERIGSKSLKFADKINLFCPKT